jgi:hypothetical protein
MKVGLLVAVVLSAGLASVSWAGLMNPSFEDLELEQDNPYGDLAAHWGRWGEWMNRETGWKPTKSGKCLMGYHHWDVKGSDSSGFYQDVDGLEPGAEYEFSVFAMKDAKTNADKVELRIEKMGGFVNLASQIYPVAEIPSGKWTRLNVKGKVPAEENAIRVLVIAYPSQSSPRDGAIKFDDADLVKQ